MDSHTWWYLARAGGIVAWGLLAASVMWGLALSTRLLGPRPRPNWMLDLHRFLGGLAVIFTGVHVLGLVLDSYVHFGPVEILIPFTGDYRPTAVAWGIIATYLLIAVEITSLMRKKLSKRAWHLTHMLSFPVFGFATAHGLMAGTDSSNALLWVSMLVVTILVVAMTIARLDIWWHPEDHTAPHRGRPRIPEGVRGRQ